MHFSKTTHAENGNYSYRDSELFPFSRALDNESVNFPFLKSLKSLLRLHGKHNYHLLESLPLIETEIEGKSVKLNLHFKPGISSPIHCLIHLIA